MNNFNRSAEKENEMKLLYSTTFNDIPYDVFHANTKEVNDFLGAKEGGMGAHYLKTQQILICHEMSEKIQERVFIHETMHAICAAFGYQANFSEEELCDIVSSHLHLINEKRDEFLRHLPPSLEPCGDES